MNNNDLTKSTSSAISNITIQCKVKILNISDKKTIGEDARLHSIISNPSSMLEELHMSCVTLSSGAAIELFTALSESKKLKALWINNSKITNEACDAIVMAVKKNTSLIKLKMKNNPISGKCMQRIVNALQHNNTL